MSIKRWMKWNSIEQCKRINCWYTLQHRLIAHLLSDINQTQRGLYSVLYASLCEVQEQAKLIRRTKTRMATISGILYWKGAGGNPQRVLKMFLNLVLNSGYLGNYSMSNTLKINALYWIMPYLKQSGKAKTPTVYSSNMKKYLMSFFIRY